MNPPSTPPTHARFPHVKQQAGHYESFYLKACHPDGGLGVWIRYTVHKSPNQAPKGFIWFTLFDAAAGVRASKVEFATPETGAGDYIRFGDHRFAPGRIEGRADSQQLDASWQLSFAGSEPPLWHLPAGFMYNAPFPRTKVLSPHPNVVFQGQIDAAGRRLEVDGWPGMIGHNWGAEHARRGIWLHGANFASHEDAWLDMAAGRIGVGRYTTPWLANGALALDGRRYRLGGIKHLQATEIIETPESCRFRFAGDGITVEGTASAPRERFVGWIYAQPPGGEHQTVNCSIADVTLDVSRADGPALTLAVSRGGAYELQMQESYPQIPVQPFPDG